MLEIKIEDHVYPKERRLILEIAPILYALKKFNGHLGRSAKFLGMTGTRFISVCKRHETLVQFIKDTSTMTFEMLWQIATKEQREKHTAWMTEFVEPSINWRASTPREKKIIKLERLRVFICDDQKF